MLLAVPAEVSGREYRWSAKVVCILAEDLDDFFPGGGWTGRIDGLADDQLCEAVSRGDRVTIAAFVSVHAASAETLQYGSNSWAKVEWFLWKPRSP